MSLKSPAFRFYANDFLTGTVTMSLLERGAYISLLAYQWDHGSVPTTPLALARILGCAQKEAAVIWGTLARKFPPDEAGLCRNRRLEVERDKQTQRREHLAANGRAGALARWVTPSGKNGKANG